MHIKVPLTLMQEIVGVLTRLPYATVAVLMPKLEALSIDDDGRPVAESRQVPAP